MKTVYLFRHAHAAHPDPGMDDHDRPLSPRGEGEADTAGAFFREQGITPELVLCSSALRTTQTLARALGDAARREHIDRLFYLAARDTLLEEIRAADDAVSRLMLVGHNPGMGELADKLAAATVAETGEQIMGFPPAAMAGFTCNVDTWENFDPKAARLAVLYMP